MASPVEWLYRAGDNNGPCFHGEDEPEVWMFRTLKLFLPFLRIEEKWRTIWKLPLYEVEKACIQYQNDDDVCVAYVTEENQERNLEEKLSALRWQKIDAKEYTTEDDNGYPTIDHLFVARAVNFYAKEKHCRTPEDLNTMAEVKAAALWRFPEDEPKESIEGDVTDPVLQMAAMFTWTKLAEMSNLFRNKYDDAFDESNLEYLEGLTVYEINQETMGGISSYLHWCKGSVVLVEKAVENEDPSKALLSSDEDSGIDIVEGNVSITNRVKKKEKPSNVLPSTDVNNKSPDIESDASKNDDIDTQTALLPVNRQFSEGFPHMNRTKKDMAVISQLVHVIGGKLA